jgi:mannitol-1-phosphate 5-dehydrogenase
MTTRNRKPLTALKIVVFGAGKIGRSFIGQVFSKAGYEVVFVDIDSCLTEALTKAGRYRVVVKGGETDEIITVSPVRAVCLREPQRVVQELADASLAACCVGQKGIPAIIPLFAEALLLRRKYYGNLPIDLILAENMRNADMEVRKQLLSCLPEDYPLDNLVGLVETSIGKMVPIMTRRDQEEDPLQVFAEPYNTLVVSATGFRNPIPRVEDLAPKQHIKAWVDRKLFIHNLGHATAAYLGYIRHPGRKLMADVLKDPRVLRATRMTMLQSARILMALYPGEFTPEQLTAHIDDLLHRFRNRTLGDTVFRVGCDLGLKLGPEDRLLAPLRAAIRLGLPYHLILEVIKAAMHFRATDEHGEPFPADREFFREVQQGTDHILRYICTQEPDFNRIL